MSAYETRHLAGAMIGVHRHELAYAALVLSGGYEESGPDGVWRVEAGDLIVHPPFHLHLNRFSKGAARVLNLSLTHASARKLGIDRYSILQLVDPARVAKKGRGDALTALGEALEDAAPRRAATPRDWIDALAASLQALPSARISSLAAAYGVTPEHAARAFARRFGMTPATFRAEQRLRAGLQALNESQSLAAIAARCGYADQAHFGRAIKAATGETPGKLRLAFA